ncbi:hypothetical protein MKW92_031598 [Papaver armeniacum]|nr:hypothetical protein MKW92_031598 [Papaver armeniacum]
MKMRGFHLAAYFSQLSKAARLVHATRPLCTKAYDSKAIAVKPVRDDDAYRQLENLDFRTAAKMLFSDPPKKKEFGLDFHLIQFFFCCLPSVAVYMVAQYARYEIRRMEAMRENRKRKGWKQTPKESEEAASAGELLKVKDRLEALEEAFKEMVVEKKKPSLHSSEESKKSEKDNSDQQSKTQPFNHERAADSRSERGGETAEKITHPKK